MKKYKIYEDEDTLTIDKNGALYEMDKQTGRCYMLEASKCLRADCDGKLVKRRIAKSWFDAILEVAKEVRA